MYTVILVTAKDEEEAQRIAVALLNERLIACANIVKDVRSLFWWDGKVDTAQEVMLVLKSKKNLFAKIARVVKSVHSYQVPEIIALPIISGDSAYLKWIDTSTRKGKKT
jgi:periplasmic divalent cation tolerance protein